MDLHVIRLLGWVFLLVMGVAFVGSAASLGRRTRIRAKRWALIGGTIVCLALDETLYDLHTVGLITTSTARSLEWVQWLLVAGAFGCIIFNMLLGPIEG